MLFRIFTLLLSTFCFVSCATYQENPNYSYSTSYLHSKNEIVFNSEFNEIKKDDNRQLLVKTLYSASDEVLLNNISSTLSDEQVLSVIDYDYSVNSLLAPKEDYEPNITKASIHKVVKGDTIYSLAKMLCQNIEEIDKLNNLNSSYNIQLGVLLILPPDAC